MGTGFSAPGGAEPDNSTITKTSGGLLTVKKTEIDILLDLENTTSSDGISSLPDWRFNVTGSPQELFDNVDAGAEGTAKDLKQDPAFFQHEDDVTADIDVDLSGFDTLEFHYGRGIGIGNNSDPIEVRVGGDLVFSKGVGSQNSYRKAQVDISGRDGIQKLELIARYTGNNTSAARVQWDRVKLIKNGLENLNKTTNVRPSAG